MISVLIRGYPWAVLFPRWFFLFFHLVIFSPWVLRYGPFIPSVCDGLTLAPLAEPLNLLQRSAARVEVRFRVSKGDPIGKRAVPTVRTLVCCVGGYDADRMFAFTSCYYLLFLAGPLVAFCVGSGRRYVWTPLQPKTTLREVISRVLARTGTLGSP